MLYDEAKKIILHDDHARLFQQRYRYLLMTQFVFVVWYSLLEGMVGVMYLLELTLVATLLAGVFVATIKRRQFVIAVMLASVLILSRWSAIATSTDVLYLISYAAGAAFFLYIVVIVTFDIFTRSEKVTVDLIYGAVSVYWLLGLVFAFIYVLLEVFFPGSFIGNKLEADSIGSSLSSFVYFSFVTLTTLGYGDISPLSRVAGVLSYLEAILGQLYLAIMVARLVGMYLVHSQTK